MNLGGVFRGTHPMARLTVYLYVYRHMKQHNYSTLGNALPLSLAATAIIGFITVMSLVILPFQTDVVADMRLSPTLKTLTLGEIFEVEVIVESKVPVNVFAGDLSFDTSVLQVESIDYNTSIADLWAEKPWYSNGDGTLTFAGGTTQNGGFVGADTLIKITFKTLREGSGSLAISNAQILQHDGLGTSAQLAEPIDAIFTVQEEQPIANLVQKNTLPSTYAVVETIPTTDLNGDGKQSIADTSIFLMNMRSSDMRFDFNMDGSINLKDFNILLGVR